MVLVPSLGLAQGDLRHAREMLQNLNEERSEAAATGASSGFTQGYLDKRLADITGTVNSGVLSKLNARPRASCAGLQEELRSSLGYGGRPDPNVASVVCVQWSGSVYYIVGYALAGAATYSRSWIGVFAPSTLGGTYQLVTSTDNSLPSKTVALKKLPFPIKAKLSFLAYGINWADAHSRLTVIAYSLSGSQLEAIWSRPDLSHGELKVEGARIKLTFLSSPLGPGYKSVHEIAEAYDATPSGITLRQRSERPRP